MTGAGALAAGVAAAAELMHAARDPWWVIGSAAVALHLGRAIPVGDVDVLASPRDAAAALLAAGVGATAPVPNERFRSAVFGGLLPVEIMGGLAVHDGDAWRTVIPARTMRIDCSGVIVPVPSRDDMIAILTRFGRPKDLARLALLAS